MMKAIQVVIEGEDAIAATTDLLQIPGISGSWQSGEPEKEGVLATIATIVGIVGGSMAIAEQIYQWYQRRQQEKSDQRIEKVLIITSRGRILLEDATVEQIAKALEPLAK